MKKSKKSEKHLRKEKTAAHGTKALQFTLWNCWKYTRSAQSTKAETRKIEKSLENG